MIKFFFILSVMSFGIPLFASDGATTPNSSDLKANVKKALDQAHQINKITGKKIRETCRIEMQNELLAKYLNQWKTEHLVLDSVEMRGKTPLFLRFYLKDEKTGEQKRTIDVLAGSALAKGYKSFHNLPKLIPAAKSLEKASNQILITDDEDFSEVDEAGNAPDGREGNFGIGDREPVLSSDGYAPILLVSKISIDSSSARHSLFKSKTDAPLDADKTYGRESKSFEDSGLSVDFNAYRACLVRELKKNFGTSTGNGSRSSGAQSTIP